MNISRPIVWLQWLLFCGSIFLSTLAQAQSCNIAVWADGGTSSGSNNVDLWLESFGCTPTFVTNADLDTSGFLDSFDAIFVTRQNSGGGLGLDLAGALNVKAYVNGNNSSGRVIIFLNDWLDDNPFNTGGDPPDGHTSIVMRNAVKVAAASGHGYVGEYNGASMALHSNDDGYRALGLLPGDATAPRGEIACDAVTQIAQHGHLGIGDFTPLESSCFGINTSGFGTLHVVYQYTSGEPAVVDNYPLSPGAPLSNELPPSVLAPVPSPATTARRASE